MLHDEQLFDETVMDQEPSPLKYFGFSVCLCLFVHLNEPKPTLSSVPGSGQACILVSGNQAIQSMLWLLSTDTAHSLGGN